MPEGKNVGQKTWKLPPLILHPFSDAGGPEKLLESSRADLMLQGLLPHRDLTQDQLERKLLEGRYCEIRMLFYLGKDVVRWIEQCLEFAGRDDNLRGLGLKFQSFADLLISGTPAKMREKLKQWGVLDYRAIFARAIGINSVFAQLPAPEALSPVFIREYFRYADQMFTCRQNAVRCPPIRAEQFDVDLFASGEYTRMLERQWRDRPE
jgi:hypothetical protein